MLQSVVLIFGALFALLEINPVAAHIVRIVSTPSRGTIHPFPEANFTSDAEIIHNLLTQGGKNVEAAMDLLTNRSTTQRIKTIYEVNRIYGNKALFATLLPLANENLVNPMAAAFSPLPTLYSTELDAAIDEKNEDTILEIFLSMDNELMQNTLKEYLSRYEDDFMESFNEQPFDEDFKTIIGILSKAKRDESSPFDPEMVKKDLATLVKMTNQGEDVDKIVLKDILLNRRDIQCAETVHKFRELTGKRLRDVLQLKIPYPLSERYATIVKFRTNKIRYFAEKLRDALRKKDDGMQWVLNRIIIGRAEIDLEDIKEYFHNFASISLYDAVKNATSGEYQSLLLRFIRN